MKTFTGFEKGMGIGGWLTNYKRFNVLPQDKRMDLTIGDFEHFETYILREDIENIASMGLDHVRLGFDQIVLEESDGVYRENICTLLENFIQWCCENNLNVVLNLHKAIGNYCDIDEDVQLLDDAALQERFIRLWLFLEERFSEYPCVAFELLNEVRNVDPKKWNNLARRTVEAIRKVNPDRILIIGSIRWNHPANLQDLEVLDDENVVYTFHMYAPHEFTHQRGVLSWTNLYYNRKMFYPDTIERYNSFHDTLSGTKDFYAGYDRMDKQYLHDYMQPALDFIKAHPDKILWCGEFGTIRHADLTSRENWMRDVIAFLKENHIPYCVWNYLSTPNDGNRFSLVDDDERRILSPRLERILRGEFGCRD